MSSGLIQTLISILTEAKAYAFCATTVTGQAFLLTLYFMLIYFKRINSEK